MTILSHPPPISENPYQRLLYDAVRAAGGNVHDRGIDVVKDPVPDLPHPGILHVHWVWLKRDPLRAALGFLRARRRLRRAVRSGWRLVWTAHNVLPHDRGIFPLLMQRELARRSHGVIVHGEEARKRLLERFPLDQPLAVIPHGHYRDAYDPPPRQDEARVRLGLDPEKPVFLFFGQVRRYKGIDRLVDAFAKSDLDATLLIGGKPLTAAFRRELLRLARGDPRIRFSLGFVDGAEVPSWFAASDWVVLPFREITTSGSLILALSFGRPVIIPAHPALVEVTGETAAETYYGDDDLIPALARALRRDQEAAARAALARTDSLDWGRIGRATVEFFERVANHDGS